jgi:hypothetical protein
MIRLRLRGVTPLFVLVCAFALPGGVALFATPAWAQQECSDPEDVPESVYFTIVNNADVLFGDLTDGQCNGIVNQGKSTCRAQTNAAASCLERSVNALYDIDIIQCNQRENQMDREDCKDEMKAWRDGAKGAIKDAKEDALAVCANLFEIALDDACHGVVKK